MLPLTARRKELLLNGVYQPIDVNAIAKDANLQELNKFLELLVGVAIRCENKRERTAWSLFPCDASTDIQHIMALPKETQQQLMAVINEVRLAWRRTD